MKTIDPDNYEAPYIQVANAIRQAIRNGEFVPGEQLPTRAQLTSHFGVAPMTVTSAIRELRQGGWVVTRQGSGVYVRTRRQHVAGPDLVNLLAEYINTRTGDTVDESAIAAVLAALKAHGVDVDSLVKVDK